MKTKLRQDEQSAKLPVASHPYFQQWPFAIRFNHVKNLMQSNRKWKFEMKAATPHSLFGLLIIRIRVIARMFHKIDGKRIAIKKIKG
jgi:hypothetical protein